MLYTITTLATACLPPLQSLPSLASQPSGATPPGTSIPRERHTSGSQPSASLLSATRRTFRPPSPRCSPLQPLGSGAEAPCYTRPDSSCATPGTCPCSSCRPLAVSLSHSCTGVRPPGLCRSARSLRCPRTSPILGTKNKGGHLSNALRLQVPDPWLPKTHTPYYNNRAHDSTPITCQAHPHVTRGMGMMLGPS